VPTQLPLQLQSVEAPETWQLPAAQSQSQLAPAPQAKLQLWLARQVAVQVAPLSQAMLHDVSSSPQSLWQVSPSPQAVLLPELALSPQLANAGSSARTSSVRTQ